MAKLTINKNPEKRELIGGTPRAELLAEIERLRNEKLKTCRPEDIQTASPFKELFPVKDEILKALQESMRKIGFDPHHPVLLWKERGVLIDGHCRIQAALSLGMDEILFVEKSFSSETEALRYAFSLQFHRRNLDEADRFMFVEGLFRNNVVAKEFFRDGINRNNLAPLLSVAVSTAQKYISVIRKGNEADKEKIRIGEATVNSIYKKISLPKTDETDKAPTTVMKARESLSTPENIPVVSLSLNALEAVFRTWKTRKESDITRTIRAGVVKDLFAGHKEVWELYKKI